MAFNVAEFRRRRKIKYWAGVLMFWPGLFFIPVDMWTSFPTPTRGAFVLGIWFPMVIVGGIFYYLSKKLPLEETIGIAKEHNNELTVADLVSELEVTLGTAENVLGTLQRKGYVKAQKRGNLIVWVFIESRDANGVKKDKKIDEFLEPCEEALGEIQELLEQLKPGTFKQSVERFCAIVRQHIDNFRDDPSDVEHFVSFPDHIAKMDKLLKEHIRLSKHSKRESVHEALYEIEDTVGKAADNFDVMLNKLLSNDIIAARAQAKTMERLMDLDCRLL